MDMKLRLELPTGTHDQVMLGGFEDLIFAWTTEAIQLDKRILQTHGEAAGKELADVVPALCYARIARTAWSLCSVARIENGDFDPVAFGKRCEEIAREQIDRYRTAFDQAGSA